MKVLKGDNDRIAKIWVSDLVEVESKALDQIRVMLRLPGLFRHVAVMPDVHLGKGAVIGGVVATNYVLVPNIVGVDIGCGVCAYNTGVPYVREVLGRLMDKSFWREWKSLVDRVVPTGFSKHEYLNQEAMIRAKLTKPLHAEPLRYFQEENAPLQLGTLGGGNHFMEATYDEEGIIWLTVHSGSRNTGLQIADYYAKLAIRLNERWHSSVPRDAEGTRLGFLPLDSDEGRDYFADMNWATDFALENRYQMLEAMGSAFRTVLDRSGCKQNFDFSKLRQEAINIHHNFAALENHYGTNVIVHRKGATRARMGEIGIIPGSMGAPTYIVEGLGSEESYQSCSHGAGRTMSRKAAKQTISEADFASSMSRTFTSPSTKYLDEAPGAYKSIEKVMSDQQDLVKIVHILRPIITIKGEGE